MGGRFTQYLSLGEAHTRSGTWGQSCAKGKFPAGSTAHSKDGLLLVFHRWAALSKYLQLLIQIWSYWRSSWSTNLWPPQLAAVWKCVDRKGPGRHQCSIPETVLKGSIILPVPEQKSSPGFLAHDQRAKAPFHC